MKPRWLTALALMFSKIAWKVGILLLVLIALSGPVVLIALGSPAIANKGKGNGNGHVVAPEIDPGALSGAVTLLVSGTLILTDRLRRK
jgi:hypothetical protein